MFQLLLVLLSLPGLGLAAVMLRPIPSHAPIRAPEYLLSVPDTTLDWRGLA